MQPSSPWQVTAIVSALSAIGALIGGAAAYKTVSDKQRDEHDDAACQRAKRVFESFHDGMLVVNRDLTIILANKQARAITGYVDLVGRSVYELIPERFRDMHKKHVGRFFDDPHTRRMGTAPMQLMLVDRYGREKEMRLSLTPAEDDYGGIEVTVGMSVVQQ